MKKIFSIWFAALCMSCSQSAVPKGILNQDKMEKVVYDLLKVDEYLNNYVSKDTTVSIKMKRSLLYEQVFKLHDTNRKEFYTSYSYYQQHPDIQKNLFDSVTAKAASASTVPTHIIPMKSIKEKIK